MKTILLSPRMSEKVYNQSQTLNTYVFDVSGTTNKVLIKKEVEVQFQVGVASVNVTNMKGKVKRSVINGKSKFGKRKAIKKAYVTLKKGNTLPFFASVAGDDTSKGVNKLIKQTTTDKDKKS